MKQVMQLCTTTYEHYAEFYRLYDDYLTKFKNSITSIEKEIYEHFQTFSTEIVKKNNGNIDQFEDLIDKISDAKKLLEKTKHNYFESSKDVVEQEEKIIKLSEKNKIKEDEMIHLRDNLVKLQKKSEGECENYKCYKRQSWL